MQPAHAHKDSASLVQYMFAVTDVASGTRQNWRRTDPIAAATRCAIDLLAVEALNEAGGSPRACEGVEAGVASVTVWRKERITDGAVCLPLAIDSCAFVQTHCHYSDVFLIASSSSAGSVIAVSAVTSLCT